MNTFKKKFLGGMAAGAAVLALSACLLPVGDGEGLGRSGDPLTDTTFTLVFNEVFSQSQPSCTGCHGAYPSGDALRLNNPQVALASLFGPGKANRLTTTDTDENPRWRIYLTSDSTGVADSSYLYVKLITDTPKNGTRMPQGGSPLTADQIKVVRRWIETGAKF